MDERGNGMTGLRVDIRKKLRDFTLDVSMDEKSSMAAEGDGWGRTEGCLGILGASGCGKSMMLKSIAGIVEPDEGMIRMNGRVLYDSAARICLPARKRRVGYLFQDYALFPNMTVEENIFAGLKTGIYRKRNRLSVGEMDRRVRDMVGQFRLEGLERQYPNRLSGGQKQRVALARILCYEPELLMLDEPFSAMDAHLKERLRLELTKILAQYRGRSILVTHDRDEAYQLCDRLILMDQGAIIGRGGTKELFLHPQTVKAAVLTGCKNIARAVRLHSHRVRALEWNVELETEQEVDDSVTHIGIRAHDMIPVANGECDLCPNVVEVGRARVSEMPFEWYVTLENGLWWKAGKQAGEHSHTFLLPHRLRIPKEAVLPLREG